MEQREQDEEGMTLMDLLTILRKHIITVVVSLVVVFAAVAAYTFTRTPQYTATTQLFATYRGTTQDSGSVTEFNSGATYIESQIATYPQLVKTESVLQPVIDDLGLDLTVTELANQVTASNPTDTMLVDIDVVDPDPKTASDIANSVGESMCDQVTSSLYNEDGDELMSPINLSVVQQAYVPSSPSSPNVMMNLAIGVVGGLVVGAVLAIVRNLLDRKVRQASDVTAVADDPILGTVTRSDSYADKNPVIIARPMSRESEQIRRLRTNLTFASASDGKLSNVIVVTSSGPSEGKTTISINLAMAFAESGSKVLLIDADVRNPSVSKRLGIEGTVGLTHLVTNQASSRDVIQRYWKQNMHLLPAGEQTMNPSVLLNSRAMKALIAQVAEAYDYVIIDTAPLQVSNDAAVFAKEGASLLMIVGLDVAEKKRLRTAEQELGTLGIQPVGTVLNLAEADKQQNNVYYYYSDSDEDKGRHRKDDKKSRK